MTTRKIITKAVGQSASTYVGKDGELFYDTVTNSLKISDGSTPGGATLSTAGDGVLVSNTANLGVFFGSGIPTLSAAQGSLYLRTDGNSGSSRLYVNTTGSNVWTNVFTAN